MTVFGNWLVVLDWRNNILNCYVNIAKKHGAATPVVRALPHVFFAVVRIFFFEKKFIGAFFTA